MVEQAVPLRPTGPNWSRSLGSYREACSAVVEEAWKRYSPWRAPTRAIHWSFSSWRGAHFEIGGLGELLPMWSHVEQFRKCGTHVMETCWSGSWRSAACGKPLWDRLRKMALWSRGKEWSWRSKRGNIMDCPEPPSPFPQHCLQEESRKGCMGRRNFFFFLLLISDSNKLK